MGYIPSSGTPELSLIATLTLSVASSFTFSSIPQTYSGLFLRLFCKKNETAGAGSALLVYLQANGSTGNPNNQMVVRATGTTMTVSDLASLGNGSVLGYAHASDYSPYSLLEITIPDYASAVNHGVFTNYSTIGVNANGYSGIGQSYTTSAAAITSLTILVGSGLVNFTVGSKAYLYGIN